MRICLVGIACVGKTAIGSALANKLDYEFLDFDREVMRHFDTHLLALMKECVDNRGYRARVTPLLAELLEAHRGDLVITVPPGGMFCEYRSVLEDHPDVVTVWLRDSPENIFERIIFTDDDDELIEVELSDYERKHYFQEIVGDIDYFSPFHAEADVWFDIGGRGIEESADALCDVLEKIDVDEARRAEGRLESLYPNADQYQLDCLRLTKENEVLLSGFWGWLYAKGLKLKTVSKHVGHLEFYLNTYLLRADAVPANEGWMFQWVDDFLGFFLIRRCMWSVPSTIKQNGASFKKFYEYMAERGEITREDLASLKRTLKEGMPEWVEDCRLFNEPDYDYFGMGGFPF